MSIFRIFENPSAEEVDAVIQQIEACGDERVQLNVAGCFLMCRDETERAEFGKRVRKTYVLTVLRDLHASIPDAATQGRYQQALDEAEKVELELSLLSKKERKTIRKSLKICSVCQKHDLKCKTCDACRAVQYCSRACQKKAWPMHKKQCGCLANPEALSSVAAKMLLVVKKAIVDHDWSGHRHMSWICILTGTGLKCVSTPWSIEQGAQMAGVDVPEGKCLFKIMCFERFDEGKEFYFVW